MLLYSYFLKLFGCLCSVKILEAEESFPWWTLRAPLQNRNPLCSNSEQDPFVRLQGTAGFRGESNKTPDKSLSVDELLIDFLPLIKNVSLHTKLLFADLDSVPTNRFHLQLGCLPHKLEQIHVSADIDLLTSNIFTSFNQRWLVFVKLQPYSDADIAFMQLHALMPSSPFLDIHYSSSIHADDAATTKHNLWTLLTQHVRATL